MTMFERESYSVECADGSNAAVMRGVMRLASPSAYDSAFATMRARIERAEASTIDVTGVSYMNSSGIRALASLVLLAKSNAASLRMVASDSIPWQKKTMASFRAIHPGLAVELR